MVLPQNYAGNPEQNSAQWALICRQYFWRERLTLLAQRTEFDLDGRGGSLQSVRLEYDWNGNWKTGLKLVDYFAVDHSLLANAGDRDRIVLAVDYHS